MAEIPENEVTMHDVMQWYTMAEQLKKLKAAEMMLRQRIVKKFFPTPREGTNSHELDDGYVMKAKCGIDRKVEEAVLTSMMDKFAEAGISTDKLIKRKPELVVKEYRKLEEDTSEAGVARLKLFDQCLLIKPESAQLEIVLPARASAGTTTR